MCNSMCNNNGFSCSGGIDFCWVIVLILILWFFFCGGGHSCGGSCNTGC